MIFHRPTIVLEHCFYVASSCYMLRVQAKEGDVHSASEEGTITVFCRFRPLLFEEKNNCITFEPDLKSVKVQGADRTLSFSFDHVFSPDSEQSVVFGRIGERLLADIKDGYSATIIAYGQTASGIYNFLLVVTIIIITIIIVSDLISFSGVHCSTR